ncbi:MAG: DUF4783 domain-containing protein [Bacteroidales bacterium]
MIHLFSVVLFALLPLGFMQTADDMAIEVTKALEQGDSKSLARHFGPNADLYLPGTEGTFSRSQSEVILRDFFSKNPPASFSVSRQGPSRDGSIYVIGTLKMKDGSSYRTYYLIKKVSQSFFLHQLQLELL